MGSSLNGKRAERPSPDPQDDNRTNIKRAKPLDASQSFADVLKEMPVNESLLGGLANAIRVHEDLVFQYVDTQPHHANGDVALVFGMTEEGTRVLIHVTNLSSLPPSKLYTPFQSFMRHYEITAMSWMEISASTFEAVHGAEMLSYNQVEFAARHENMLFHRPEGQWAESVPLRILSFHIETMLAPLSGSFTGSRSPRYEHEPIIQIGNILTLKGAPDPYSRWIFTLDTCSDIPGAEVKPHETEADMLRAWREFVIETDPDLIIGYNIGCLDFPQLILRAGTLGLADFPYLGRLKDVPAIADPLPVKHRKLQDAPVLAGRLQLDIMQYMRESKIKRSNFTTTKKPKCDLDTIAFEFIGKRKEGITPLESLQLGGPDDRRKLAMYCLEGTHLPLEIMQCDQLRCLDESVDAARLSEKYMYRPFREFLRNGRNLN
ncbi:ribonuclease H-like domain-containing protein [Mycena vulgaris]|nr:ribonuclease H-like domain-containing protein [Mycena vulgaris]